MPCLIVDGQQWTSQGLTDQNFGATVNTWLTQKIAAA